MFAILSSLSLLYFQESNDLGIDSEDENGRLELTFGHNDCSCRRNEKISVEQMSLKEYRVRLSNNRSYEIDLNSARVFRVGCDLRKVLRRGLNQRIVSYSLFGDDESVINDKYTQHLTHLAHEIRNHFPDWSIRIYYDGRSHRRMPIVCALECLRDQWNNYIDNVDFCDVNELPFDAGGTRDLTTRRTWSAKYIHAMIWRWLPIGDSLVDAFMSRDTDSLIVRRELDSVRVWIRSNQSGHIMRGFHFFFTSAFK